MKKIKIAGFFILLVSLILVLIFFTTSDLIKQQKEALDSIGTQKSYVQDISKTVFYTQRHQKTLPRRVDTAMYHLFGTLHGNAAQTNQIDTLAQEFYRLVNDFKYLYVKNIPYYTTIMEKQVNDIYKKSMELVVALNKKTAQTKAHYDHRIETYKNIQYLLFALLILMLLYIFTQMDEVIRFVQKFTTTSDRMLERSSVKGLEPIALHTHNQELHLATQNFNTLVKNIDSSIKLATESTAHTIEMLESVEENIELLLSLMEEMEGDEKVSIDRKEETIIESLEQLMDMTLYLKNLKKNLKKLI